VHISEAINIRRPLEQEMLDLEKGEFTKKMNFKNKIPKLIVKITNTYFSKLSLF
jgi:hypothetical protein